jgi:hypothetical protein
MNGLETNRDSHVLEDLAALPGLTSPRRMTPHTPALPKQTMRPLDRAPVEQGPHAPDPAGLLWVSAQRIEAIRKAEAADAEDAARLAYAERQRLEDEERHRAGVRRMLRAEEISRNRRDQEDANRR